MLKDLQRMVEWMINRYHDEEILKSDDAAEIITIYLSIIRKIETSIKEGDAAIETLYHIKNNIYLIILNKTRNIEDLSNDALSDNILCKNPDVKIAIEEKIRKLNSQINAVQLFKTTFSDLFR